MIPAIWGLEPRTGSRGHLGLNPALWPWWTFKRNPAFFFGACMGQRLAMRRGELHHVKMCTWELSLA